MSQVESYTEEENVLGDEFCDRINSNPELKKFFQVQTTKALKTFAAEMIKSCMLKDVKKGRKALEDVGEIIKAITTHVYIKVMIMKREEN